jgi:hypothetical protein
MINFFRRRKLLFQRDNLPEGESITEGLYIILAALSMMRE